MKLKKWLGIAALCCATGAAQAAQMQRQDAGTGAQTWSIEQQGVYFSLTQILPEQGDAFFVNRGFSRQQIQPFTSSCVFMTVLRNDAAPAIIHFVRKNWTVQSNGQERNIKTVAAWLQQWQEQQISKSAQIAFQWAQFPPEQEYQPGGDWNQGMLSVGLAPGTRFDITAHWDMNGEPYTTTLTEVQCAQ